MKNKVIVVLVMLFLLIISSEVSASNLKLGTRSNTVSTLQQLLIDKGFLSIEKPTGYFDALTKMAVVSFQTKNKLKADGIVGSKTFSMLNSLPKDKTTTSPIKPITKKNDSVSKSDKKPSLTLIYPNGGEVFKGGDNITVKWEGNNVSNISFPINLKYYDNDGKYMTDQELAVFVPGDSYQKIVEIPLALQQLKNVYKVSKYKISIGRVVGDDDNSFPLDISNNFFTIKRLPHIATQYATPTSTSAELYCTYKYQYGTDNPEITFEYGESPCSLTNINGESNSCTKSSKAFGSETYSSGLSLDTTERLFTSKFTVSDLKASTKYNYQCIVKNSNGQVVGYDKSSPTTYVEFNTSR